jgi:hypothetical protein
VIAVLTIVSLAAVKVVCLIAENTMPEGKRRSHRKEIHMAAKLSAIALLETAWAIGANAVIPASRAPEPTTMSQ